MPAHNSVRQIWRLRTKKYYFNISQCYNAYFVARILVAIAWIAFDDVIAPTKIVNVRQKSFPSHS